MRGAVRSTGVDVLDLYRFDVVRRSDLDLRLGAASGKRFDLQLLTDRGRRLECACGGSGGAAIRTRLRAGRYFAVVRARSGAGRYRLRRVSRTITRVGVGFGRDVVAPGRAVVLGVRVRPGVSGSVRVLLQRFDPLAGWQFLRSSRLQASGGSARLPFAPPAVGRYRARVDFLGTRTASPSESGCGFSYLRVSGPLTS